MNIFTPKVSFVVTLACNLKCKLCAAHSPYYSKPYHPSTEDLFSQVDRFFSLVSNAGYFTLSGGEPFLRKDLASVIEYISKHYCSQITTLELITNGSILPSQDVISVLQNVSMPVRIIIDDYGDQLSPHAHTLANLLKSNTTNVCVDVHDYHSEKLHCNGWVDYGLYSNVVNDSEKTKELFFKCAVPQKLQCLSYINGITYICSQSRRCVELNLTPFNSEEMVNLFHPSLSDAEIQQKILNQYSLQSLSACQFCNGLCDDSIRFRPAEQL